MVSNKFLYIVILILIGVIILMKVFTPKCKSKIEVKEVIKLDTFYVKVIDTIYSKPKLINTVLSQDTLYLMDSSGYMYKSKLEKLILEHTSKRIYQDSLILDKYGYVITIDTLQYNQLLHRNYTYNLNIPVVTKTENIYLKPKTKYYIGGGLMCDKDFKIININSDFLIQTKKDKLFGPSIILTSDLKLGYGFKTYWKL